MTFLARLSFLGVVSSLATGCSVKLAASGEIPITANQCTADRDCGSGASCSAGACFAKTGALDDVLLEIVPETTFSGASGEGISFFYAQNNLGNGNRHLDLTAKPATFNSTVTIDATNLPSDCTTPPAHFLEASVEFTQASSIGGFAAYSLSTAPVTVNVTAQGNVFGPTAIAPGTYDIYVQPKSSPSCPLPPRMLRGVEVSANPSPSEPPVSLNLPAPVELRGKVVRNSPNSAETLVGWQVDLLEPQDGRVISTTSGWPAGPPLYVSNFSITYQPVTVLGSPPSSSSDVTTSSPVLRIRPPDAMAARAPTVYWALSIIDWDGDSTVSLDLSGVPTSDKLVSITGQVQGEPGQGVPATLQFLSKSLDGTMGVTASFTQSVTTDTNGAYTTALFPGDYRMIVAASKTSNPDSGWTVTTQDITVRGDSVQPIDVALSAKRVLRGKALADGSSTPAFGAVVQAAPTLLPNRIGIWPGALANTPIVPDGANVAVSQVDGSFTLSVDPGMFDISVSPSDSSNFASWIWPHAQIAAPSSGSDALVVTPRLPFPIPVEGNLDDGSRPLPNAVIRAYAKVAGGTAVTKVGDTRTDAAGHYLLLLPPSFGP